VEQQGVLGIHIDRYSATAVLVAVGDGERSILDSFTVSVQQQDRPGWHVLASLLAQQCTARDYKFSEAFVALDAPLYMQHNVHSEFADTKQIAATVRFDTEETLATDISDKALTFQIQSSGSEGAELMVFTAEKAVLADLLVALQSNAIDPVAIEPDICCLWRYFHRLGAEQLSDESLLVILAAGSGYLIVPPAQGATRESPALMRTFLVGAKQDRTDLLRRQLTMTTALLQSQRTFSRALVFDTTASIKTRSLGRELGLHLEKAALAQPPSTQTPSDGEPVGLTIAYGAALAGFGRAPAVNFRDDFMPYQGRKLRLQNTLKYLSVSVTVFLIALGLYFQTQLFGTNRYCKQLHERLRSQYQLVMRRRTLPTRTSVKTVLQNELRRIKDAKSGLISIKGEKSVSSKLALVLDAFNRCARQTQLHIKSISVTSREITITGDTSSRANTLRFFQAIKNSGLEILKQAYSEKAGRDNFSLTVVPKT